MKTIVPFTCLNIAFLYLLRFGYDDTAKVYASQCGVQEKLLVKSLVKLHNESVRRARWRYGGGPIHFAEVCAGYCGPNNEGGVCAPNCICRVIDAITPHIYLCFEQGKPLPLGFH
uniref:Uncharacterized protein n=1 Tax=Rhipicephalus zambeziensis TaxID=60191 RepID=A0A224YR20_9ACAR